MENKKTLPFATADKTFWRNALKIDIREKLRDFTIVKPKL